MKKLFLMVVAAMMATVSVNAQEEGKILVKPMVGGVLSTLVGDVDGAKMKVGIVAGAEGGYFFKDNIAVTVGVLYTMQGCKGDSDLGDVKYNYEYLNLPLLGNYYLPFDMPVRIALKAGGQIGILTKAKQKIGSSEFDFKDHSQKIDFSVPMGIGVEFNNFVVDLRYNLGVTNIFKDDIFDSTKVRNSVFMMTVGYQIPF